MNKTKVKLDLTRLAELECEGLVNNICRKIQIMRKENGFNKEDKMDLSIDFIKELPEDISYFDVINWILKNKGRLNFENLSFTKEFEGPFYTKDLEINSPWGNEFKLNIKIYKKN